MNKACVVLLVLTAFVIGIVAGGWSVSRFWGSLASNASTSSMASEARNTVRTLESLRSGNTSGAIDLLEADLDVALIGLGALVPEIPLSRREPLYTKAIQLARDYRTNFPRTNNPPEIMEAIQRAFDLLDKAKGSLREGVTH